MIVQFSGGKDSLAVLSLLRDVEGVKAYFSDTGGVYPHIVDFVHETCHKWEIPLRVIKPVMPVGEYTDKFGLPSDIIPVNRSPEMKFSIGRDSEQKIQSMYQCCSNMLWIPMMNAIIKGDDKLVARGIKLSDKHKTAPPGYIDENGITYILPIYDWTDNDVFNYLKKNGIKPAKHYEDINVSFDCWGCTAHLSEDNAREKIKWTKTHYPELWPVLRQRFKEVRRAVDQELGWWYNVIKEVPPYNGVVGFNKLELKRKQEIADG